MVEWLGVGGLVVAALHLAGHPAQAFSGLGHVSLHLLVDRMECWPVVAGCCSPELALVPATTVVYSLEAVPDFSGLDRVPSEPAISGPDLVSFVVDKTESWPVEVPGLACVPLMVARYLVMAAGYLAFDFSSLDPVA